ncbi:hypothetical protein JCM8547_006652 [Rhodosporidiobolus lusitaniae]
MTAYTPTTQDVFLPLKYAPTTSPYLRNWSSTYNHTPSLFFQPVSAQEIASIFRAAKERGKKVRVVGEFNSPGPGWHGEWIISTKHFRTVQITRSSSSSSSPHLALLGSGLTLREANALLASYSLSFTTIGSIDCIALGSCFSGPDHGTSAYHSLISSSARAVTIVTPDGEVRRTKRGEELFRAAGAGVGGVGCVVEVEWEVEEAFGLEVTFERIKLGEYLKDESGKALYDLARSEEFVKIWHFPHSLPSPLNATDTILWRARRVPFPPASPPPSYFSLLTTWLSHVLHGLLILFTMWVWPGAQGYVNGVLYWMAAWGLPKREVKRGYEAMLMDCKYSQLVNEWTVPLPHPSSLSSLLSSQSSPSQPSSPVSPALQFLRPFLTYIHPSSPTGHALGMHAPVEIRFSKCEREGEGFWLSPAAALPRRKGEKEEKGEKGEGKEGEDDLVMWVEPIVYTPLRLPPPPRFFPFFQSFESLLRLPSVSGRPHWAKAHFPTSPAELARMFGRENVEEYHRVRAGADREGTVWTRWMEERVPGGGRGKEGSAQRESEREGKRTGRWEDVMGSRK